ncbi:MAG: hypothetical protein ACYTAF_11590 [Planctomycetota bacterium]|jgi:hypothetical protein
MEKSKKKLAELTQRSFPWRTQKLELFEDRMELHVRGVFQRFRVPFYLHPLKEEPDVMLFVPWRLIVLFTVVAAAGLVLALLGGRPADPVAGWVLALLGAAGLGGTTLLINKLHVYFYKSSGGPDGGRVRYLPQLWVYPSRPSADEVRRFEELLKIAREKQVEKVRIEHEEMIPYARELERFDSLRKDELVTEEEYAAVKAKLLNLRPRKIGFQ